MKSETSRFISIHNLPYNYDLQIKELWGRRGIRFIKELAKKLEAEVETSRNKSGNIDRRYVSGFLSKNNKVVYISISDSGCIRDLGEILYRTAENTKDYTGGNNNFAKISEEGIEELKTKVAKMLA